MILPSLFILLRKDTLLQQHEPEWEKPTQNWNYETYGERSQYMVYCTNMWYVPQYPDCWQQYRYICRWFCLCISCGWLHCILMKSKEKSVLYTLIQYLIISCTLTTIFQVWHKAQKFLNDCTLTSAFIALLVEPPVTKWHKWVSLYHSLIMWRRMVCWLITC